MRFVLACGFAVDSKSVNGRTALHRAAEHGQSAVLEQLLISGANIEAQDDRDHTPLMHAMVAKKPRAATPCLSPKVPSYVMDGLGEQVLLPTALQHSRH